MKVSQPLPMLVQYFKLFKREGKIFVTDCNHCHFAFFLMKPMQMLMILKESYLQTSFFRRFSISKLVQLI